MTFFAPVLEMSLQGDTLPSRLGAPSQVRPASGGLWRVPERWLRPRATTITDLLKMSQAQRPQRVTSLSPPLSPGGPLKRQQLDHTAGGDGQSATIR